MKVVFFNRFFYPDNSATSQILSDLAFHLARRRIDVHVVTSVVPRGEQPLEHVDGVTVHRVSKAGAGTQNIAQKALSYAAYYAGARRCAARVVSKGDVVVLKTDPPMLGAVVGPVALKKGAALVHWLQDIFPEVAQRYGIPGSGGPAGRWLCRLRDRSLRSASLTVVIADEMADRLRASGFPSERLEVVHNWANGAIIQPIPIEKNPLRLHWDLGDRFVVGYSGNLGRVHEFNTLLGAASELREDDGISFVIVGRGPRLQEVMNQVRIGGLANVSFKPHQDIGMLSQSLCVANVQISVLRPDFEGLVHPSKLYGVMAAGRPTIFIGDQKGETARILRETGAGLTVRTGDVAQLTATIRELRGDRARCEQIGQMARTAFEAKYDIPIALAKWQGLLERIAIAPRGNG